MRPVRTVIAIMFAAAIAVTGCAVRSAAVHPAAPSPSTIAAPPPKPPEPAPAPPTTTIPLGHVGRLDAVQVVGGRTVWAVGKGTILTTSDGGRSWVRVWRGVQELDQVDFVTASTGWVLGDQLLLGTVDGGQHWRQLGQPKAGRLRQVHFASPTQGWGVAGGADQHDERSVPATTLVHTSDGGRTWSALPAPTPPQSVCFTAAGDGWLASDRAVWRSGDGGRSWGSRPSFTLPVLANEPPFFAGLQCARPGAAWVRFDSSDHYAGHGPYALYTSGDGGAHWRGVLSTLGGVLTVRLPEGPGSYPGSFSVIDPQRAFLLSPTPAAETIGAVQISQGGSQLRRLPDIKGATLFMPHSVSFASTTHGWAVGANLAGQAVLVATTNGGRSWHSQLPS
jgi:photosystem II stability/assembly factor-like uncharacterized protein